MWTTPWLQELSWMSERGGSEADGRIYLDPTVGRTADGLIEAVVIDHSTSLARFGGGAD